MVKATATIPPKQANVAATRIQNMIRKRGRLREARSPSDGCLIIASTDGLADRSCAENLDCVGLSVEAIGYLPLFQLG